MSTDPDSLRLCYTNGHRYAAMTLSGDGLVPFTCWILDEFPELKRPAVEIMRAHVLSERKRAARILKRARRIHLALKSI